ncbi:hypothetical protein MUP05_00260 [Candidatus Bathyarchaeota archaeon]|nr:hypothetical protein [Candidatus Bathyarchaeota archaeon]
MVEPKNLGYLTVQRKAAYTSIVTAYKDRLDRRTEGGRTTSLDNPSQESARDRSEEKPSRDSATYSILKALWKTQDIRGLERI